MQPVALAQMKPPGHATVLMAQVPAPLHVFVVSWPPAQDVAPQLVPLAGKTQGARRAAGGRAAGASGRARRCARGPSPPIPHTLLRRWSAALHAAPLALLATHVRRAGVHAVGARALAVGVGGARGLAARRAPADEAPAQVTGLVLHTPEPLQVPREVSWPLVHVPPQLVPFGETQAPVASQSVAPQVPPDGLHAAAQQCVPVPEVPQKLLVQWAFAVQAAPRHRGPRTCRSRPGSRRKCLAGSQRPRCTRSCTTWRPHRPGSPDMQSVFHRSPPRGRCR